MAQLGLPWQQRGRATLADGRVSVFDIFEATVVWDRHRRLLPVDKADITALVGMALLEGYRLDAEVCAGGKVTITPLGRRGGG